MVFALEYLTKGALADQLHQLKPVTDLITTDNAIVSFTVIKAIIYQTLQFSRCVFLILFGKIVDFFILLNFGQLVQG